MSNATFVGARKRGENAAETKKENDSQNNYTQVLTIN